MFKFLNSIFYGNFFICLGYVLMLNVSGFFVVLKIIGSVIVIYDLKKDISFLYFYLFFMTVDFFYLLKIIGEYVN